MLFYLTVISVSVLFAVFAEMTKNASGKMNSVSLIGMILSGITLLLPLSTRTVGVDYDNYNMTYSIITAYSFQDYWRYIWEGKPEPLYVVLNFVAKAIFGSFQGVNILCGVITILFTYLTILQWKDEIDTAMCLWFICVQYYLFCYGLNRMMIAVSIIGWTYRFFFDNRYILTFICTLIAGLCHYSALLMIPFYLALKWMNDSSLNIEATAPLKAISISAIVFISICRFIPPLFRNFSWFMRYIAYFDTIINFRALNNNLLCYPVIVWLIIHLRKLKLSYYEEQLLFLIYMFLALCAVSVILPVHRVIYYFYPALALINGLIPKADRRSNEKICSLYDSISVDTLIHCMIMLFLGLFWLYKTTEFGQLWSPYLVPYKGIFFNA